MSGEWTEYNLTAAAMYRYLDREAIDAARARNAKRFFRKLKDRRTRHFAQALKRAMTQDPECHEWNIREKVVSACGIGRRMYEIHLAAFRK